MAESEDELIPESPAPIGPQPGNYVVVARRYRPQTFAELIGQEHVGRGLSGAILSHRVGHAYLFTGARGVGKTSAARILAKSLNCVNGPTPTPCNHCEICLGITSGDDMDVIEIDGASNRNIEDIRQLRQNVNVRPSRSRYKIYVIDEVHQLTKDSFNALLKTLEEPPEHVKFVFCTTEPEKIPITILSRCQRYDFAGIQASSIVERLRQIVAAEGVEAEPEALAILARRAAGSMRDSQSLLEQLLAFGSKQLTVADVHAMLGTAGGERLAGLVTHLVEHDAAGALADLDAALAEGVDVGQLLDQLLGYLRDVMAAALGCPADSFLNAAPSEHQGIVAAAERLGLETILAMMQILDHTLSRLRLSTHGRTLAELALVRIAKLADLDRLANLVAELRTGATTSSAASSSSQPPQLAKKKGDLTAAVPAYPPGVGIEGARGPSEAPASSRTGTSLRSDSRHSFATGENHLRPENARRIWDQAVGLVENMTADHARLAEAVAIRAPNQLAIVFSAKYNFSKTFCERPERTAKLEEALDSIVGQRIRLSFELADEPPAAGEVGSSRVVSPRQKKAELEAEIRRRPLVERAVKLFNASVEVLERPLCSKDLET